ncbi:protein SHI RELATED SEQUENCE 1 [Dorcoceras hygrometricum]|uniref:Protein SHI RELATED SEQUENCE 1 n=1 Tax=Dorcoceras hygrometricum TaxID=472368 RepID=A0A2Z7D1W3_9LAMI|nr:protein SHI RELATED SEQUENCE 1 [Dorcoceras hygrometricum]
MMMSGEEARETVSGGSSSSCSKCHDCGNQAKKDCSYLRCRTCCKNRGYKCHTHVKSTWVPASLRHIQPPMSAAHGKHHPPHGPNPKRHRQISALEDKFPSEVNFPAAFRCVGVRSMDNVVDEYAYQTSVRIGGHVFTGILYDRGPESEGNGNHVTGESSSATSGGLSHQPTTSTTAMATTTDA